MADAVKVTVSAEALGQAIKTVGDHIENQEAYSSAFLCEIEKLRIGVEAVVKDGIEQHYVIDPEVIKHIATIAKAAEAITEMVTDVRSFFGEHRKAIRNNFAGIIYRLAGTQSRFNPPRKREDATPAREGVSEPLREAQPRNTSSRHPPRQPRQDASLTAMIAERQQAPLRASIAEVQAAKEA